MSVGSKFSIRRYETYIKDCEEEYGQYIKRLDMARSFKLGDYLILWTCHSKQRDGSLKREISKTSYGTPSKYIVTHVDKNQMAYVQAVNSKGKPKGPLMCCYGENEDFLYESGGNFEWELDPDFAEAVILDNREQYDPTQYQREKKEIFKAITVHNKALRIDCNNLVKLDALLGGLTVGQTLWVSSKKSLTVEKVERAAKNKRLKNSIDTTVSFRDNKGKALLRTAYDLHCTALYSAQPRSYQELKDLNL
jgi:hypothetical protein